MDNPLAGQTIVVTGASGMVGSRLLPALIAADARVLATSRDPAAHHWPAGVTPVVWDGRGPLRIDVGVGAVDAVINLAGANIGGKRWTRPYMEELRRSRVETTRHLARFVQAAPATRRPMVLVNASAVGYYGRNPEGPCPEDREPGDDFLAELVQAWEKAAEEAPCRVVRLRFGHIMDASGGVLDRLLPLYRARIAGPLGNGRQHFPWVHMDDVVGAILWALRSDAAGAYNLAAPESIDYRTFNATLAKQLGVFAKLPVPGFGLRMVVGPFAPYLTGGQQVPADRLQQAGYRFQHPELEGALADLLG